MTLSATNTGAIQATFKTLDLDQLANDPLTLLCELDPKGIGQLSITSTANNQRLNEASERETSLLAFAKDITPKEIRANKLTDAASPYSENKHIEACAAANLEHELATSKPSKSFSKFSEAEKKSYLENKSITGETNRKGNIYGQTSSWSLHHEILLKEDTKPEYLTRSFSLAIESIEEAQQDTNRNNFSINSEKEQNAEFEIFLLAVNPHENAATLKPRIAQYASLCTEGKFSSKAMNDKPTNNLSLFGNEKISIKAALAGSTSTPKNVFEALSKNDVPIISAELGKNTAVQSEWTNS